MGGGICHVLFEIIEALQIYYNEKSVRLVSSDTFRLCVVVVVRRGTLKALSIICMCSISKDYILSIFLNAAVSL